MTKDDFLFLFDEDGKPVNAIRKSVINAITKTSDTSLGEIVYRSVIVMQKESLLLEQESATIIGELFGDVARSECRMEIGECRNNGSGDRDN